MSDDVTFQQEPEVRYGAPLVVSPLIRRVIARNPSAFTYTGTGTYIIGHGTVAIIDPGPALPEHIEAVLAAVAGETVSHLVVTHTHRDHSPASPALKAATGAVVVGCAQVPMMEEAAGQGDESVDRSYAPDRILADGEAVHGPGWTLRAVHTPGHTSTHLCFALEEEQALFTGDHVMGWSTSVVTPPDGDMRAYVDSLRKLLEREDRVLYPTHGPAVDKPKPFLRALINHRKMREAQIVKVLGDGPATIPAMVEQLYATTPRHLHPAAGRSVLAHLIDLEAQGRVGRYGDVYRLL